MFLNYLKPLTGLRLTLRCFGGVVDGFFVKMNISRLAGDMSHLLAIILLLLKIWKTRSCAGWFDIMSEVECRQNSVFTSNMHLRRFLLQVCLEKPSSCSLWYSRPDIWTYSFTLYLLTTP